MANKPANTIDTQLPPDSIALDPDAFDRAVETHGVRMIHHSAMKCPVGMADPDDLRRAHEHHVNCSNGYIYKKAGIARVLFTGNSAEARMMDAGLMDGSTVRVTFPRFYEAPDEGKRVHVMYADRFFLADLSTEVTDWDVIKTSPTGIDRLPFPATTIERVMDSHGREYDQNHFQVDGNGNMVWTTQDRPIAGTVCSVRYLYQPHWYASRLINEVRVIQIKDPLEGPRMERMLYSALLTRESIFRSVTNDPKSPPDERKQQPPDDGGF